ncbi:2-succinyl-6-hydroxy-2,4-cyclohexadiene-1-carboxylate synthase [Kovacikia minuta CCNUW1]|uniref:2-succinyl-6-hydroxy-2, 4-cyclohexadiene-1-carboxylate synthase n=1 Tax=Kovacikia minuta TaxID=2931930 RepID=UPI001CCBF93D|nr:2-succinyl-6-hydroxy-2,4-cyclohexadiene-1-carboxylate synthase [Kovacikia minuta]UBF26395.1 2-succinyl-6-hydroxy-2,4-cyclohexadiene-1-carboxylate synthase [Kovacikia minuta CCNUW1]
MKGRYHFYSTQQGDPSLPVVLFLHGFMGSGQDFAPVIAHLSNEFCCLTIDLPGHGKTVVEGEDRDYTMSGTAIALVDWLDQHAISQCFLVGYSMGGRLALYLALHFVQRFPRVVLESASPGLKTEQERQQRLQHDRLLAKRLESNFPAFLHHWYQQPLFQSLQQHPEFKQMVERRSQNRPHELAKSLNNLGTGQQPSLWKLLEQHTEPLLLLVGADDRKFCTINQEMASRCPTAQLEIVPESGHAIHLECPDKFVSFASQFLRKEDTHPPVSP